MRTPSVIAVALAIFTFLSAPRAFADEPGDAPSLPVKGMPRIHIEADRPFVRLFRIDGVYSTPEGEGLMVRPACEAPCDKIVDGRAGKRFFLGEPSMLPTRGFRIKNLSGDLLLRVRGGSAAARMTGFLLVGVGGAAAVGGAILLPFGLLSTQYISSEGKVISGQNTGVARAGAIALGAGAALVVTGIVFVATSRTRLDILPRKIRTTGVFWEMGKLVF